MLTVIHTGDRTSDLAHWQRIKKSLTSKVFTVDGTKELEVQQIVAVVDTVSFFQEKQQYVIQYLPVDAHVLQKLMKYEGDIFVITLQGKFSEKELPKGITYVSAKITESSLKERVTQLLKQMKVEPDRLTMLQILNHLSIEDTMGKPQLSSSLIDIFERRILALTQVYQEQSATLLKEIVAFTKEPVNQWDLVKKLFSSDKAAQSKYFAQLSQQFNFYEIIGIAKTTLFLIMAILKARQERLDNISIATKLKKSSFYIESLYRTSTDCSITFEKALSLTTRLMNLELSLKSGKFDDEKFGFDILLATL